MDEIHQCLMSGKTVELQQYIDDFPEHVETLREHFTTMRAIADLGDATEFPGDTGGKPMSYKTIGEFSVVQELGRGGMGIVYEATQGTLGRRVALKILPYAALADPRQLKRFQNEARAAASLHHANIVPIYSVGSDQGIHFFAMQLIEGASVAEVVTQLSSERTGPSEESLPTSGLLDSRGEKSTSAETKRELQAEISTARTHSRDEYFRTVARWIQQAADALAHAHENGVLHRDIKPGNLLIDRGGDLWITDFGLARLDTEASMTMTGDVMGTIRYMAPEQALAKQSLIDHRADVYSLGLTFYELLTLRPALEGHDREELLRKIAFDEPISPRKLDVLIPVELETIFRKASEKDREDRYSSAQEFSADLQRFLDHRPIQARPPSFLNRATKWTRRHRAVVSVGATAFIFTVVVTMGVLWLSNRRVTTANSQLESKNQKLTETQKQLQGTLKLASDAVDTLYSEFASDWIGEQARLTEVQMRFLTKAADVFDSLVKQSPNDSELRKKAAKAQIDLARLNDISSLSYFDQETPSRIQKSIALLQPLLANEVPDQHAVAIVTHYKSYLAAVEMKLERLPRKEAQSVLEDAKAWCLRLEHIASSLPDEKAIWKALGSAQFHLGNATRRRQERLVYYRKCLESREHFAEITNHAEVADRDLVNALNNLCAFVPAEAVQQLRGRQRDLSRQLVQRWPTRRNRYLLVMTLTNSGIEARQDRRYSQAELNLLEAVLVGSELSEQFPDFDAYRIQLISAHTASDDLYKMLGDPVSRESHIRSALAEAEHLQEDSPWIFKTRLVLAEVLARQGKKDEAIDIVMKEQERHREASGPDMMSFFNFHCGLGLTKITRHCPGLEVSEVKRLMEQAIEMLEKASGGGASADIAQELLVSWHPDRSYCEQIYTSEIAPTFQGIEPNNAQSYCSVSGTQTKWPSKHNDYNQALSFAERAHELDPQHEVAWADYGWALYRVGRYKESLDWFSKAETVMEAGHELQPTTSVVAEPNIFARLGIALACEKNGETSRGQKHLDAAIIRLRQFNVISQIELGLLREAERAFGKTGLVDGLMKTRWPGIAE